MTELTHDLSLAQAHSLIDSYDFDLGREKAQQLLQGWLEKYDASWIRLATIEALYRGRYKAISVEQILNVWLRLGVPQTHFTYEFERLICRKLPKHLTELSEIKENNPKTVETSFELFDYPEIIPTTLKLPQPKQIKPKQIKLNQTNSETTKLLENDTLGLEKAFPQPDKPDSNISFMAAWGLSYPPDWPDFNIGNKIIHQFIPLPDVSSFFNKLKTFGEESLEGQ